MFRLANLVLFTIIVLTSQSSFVDPAALPTSNADKVTASVGSHPAENAKDVEVRELENLKQPNEGKSVEIVKSHTTEVVSENGKHQEKIDLSEYIDENGKLIARVHQHSEKSSVAGEKPHERVSTEIEVPSEGVHRTVVHDSNSEGQKEGGKAFHGAARLLQSTGEALPDIPILNGGVQETTENGNRRSFNADILQEENNNIDHFTSYSGVQYSPLDMAEYIFWTGDEKGVTLAIEQFLQDGLMNREEAIQFLQEIKYNIDYLQAHYAQQRLKSLVEERMQDRQMNNDFNNGQSSPFRGFNQENMLKTIANGVYERNNNIIPSSLGVPQLVDYSDSRQDIYKKSLQENLLRNAYKLSNEEYEKEMTPTLSEEDYKELLDKLRTADFLYTEYTLEEIIYQLAKIMFAQTLSKGSNEAQLALQKFTNYLEAESEQGRITKSLEKKVLDVLLEALADTLTEHPELMGAARTGLGVHNTLPPKNKILRQLMEMGSVSEQNDIAGFRDDTAKAPLQNKYNHVPMWMKPEERPAGEHQAGPLQMQTLKRFKMSV